MKKILVVLLSLVVVVASAAGCSNKTTKSGVISGTINFYYWDQNQKPGMDAMINLFEKQNPKVKVVSTIIPWAQYLVKLQTSLPSGTGPDVFWNHPWFFELTQSNQVYDLAPLVKRDNVDMTKYPAVITKMYTSGDQIWGIPKDFDSMCIFYNKAIFDQMGVAYPKAGWTWDDFLATAQKLTNKDHFGFDADMANFTIGAGTFVAQCGGVIIPPDHKSVDVNSAAQIEGMQFCHDLIYKYKVCPTPADLAETSNDDTFTTGKAAMEEEGAWMTTAFHADMGSNVDVVELPQHTQKASFTDGLAFSIAKNTKNLNAAWAFVKFSATKEAQESTAKVVIPAYQGASDAWVAQYPSMNLQAFINSVAYAQTETYFIKNSTETKSVYTNAIAAIMSDPNANINSIMDDAQSKMLNLLK